MCILPRLFLLVLLLHLSLLELRWLCIVVTTELACLCVGWSADGRYIASGASDSRSRYGGAGWNAQLHLFSTRKNSDIGGMVPDGKQIASTSDGGTVHIWNAGNGETLAIFKTRVLMRIALSGHLMDDTLPSVMTM